MTYNIGGDMGGIPVSAKEATGVNNATRHACHIGNMNPLAATGQNIAKKTAPMPTP
jgi:hypothetical protein